MQRFGMSPKIYPSLEDALKTPEIELVIVATPNDTHFEFAKIALEAGKHGEHDFGLSNGRFKSDH